MTQFSLPLELERAPLSYADVSIGDVTEQSTSVATTHQRVADQSLIGLKPAAAINSQQFSQSIADQSATYRRLICGHVPVANAVAVVARQSH